MTAFLSHDWFENTDRMRNTMNTNSMTDRKEQKRDIRSMNLAELTEWVRMEGEAAFRAKQIYQWLHVRLVEKPEQMTNLPGHLIEKIKERGIYGASEYTRLVSEEDETSKFLFLLHDGNVVESVLMKYSYGNSVCISSQVGCRMGCRFCASAIGGLIRNLEPSEMLSQVYQIQRISGERVSHVVVMGTGEPLDNYDNLLRFIRMLTDENGLHISQRNITVSSCGIVPGIRRLAEEGLSITFALSLHSPTDEGRQKLMPVAKKYSLQEIMGACRYYFLKTGRRVTFEYALVKGENDSPEQAKQLAELVRGMNCHINLIPVNPIKERDFCRSGKNSVEKFKYILEKNQINVTIRKSMGRDIEAACGQLRRKYEETKESL